jgi:hypothetical protein
MNLDFELDENLKDVLAENTAQTVYKRLAKQANEAGKFRRRWIWELLQNAHDAADPSCGVNIRIVLDKNRLMFAHDGRPFSQRNIIHLIFHGTTKHGDQDAVGQFGTGFIATHVLSNIVDVTGVLESGHAFQFTLDRGGRDAEELKASMDRSWKAFRKSLDANGHHNQRTTTFSYPAKEEMVDSILQSIADLKRNAALVLAFNERIASIAIDGPNLKYSVRRSNAADKPADIDGCSFLTFTESDENGTEKSLQLLLVADEDVAVATRMATNGDKWSLADTSGVPRLFLAFPLTGSESFPLPAVVNSRHFIPHEDRDRLYLKDNSPDIIANRTRIEAACDKIRTIAELSASQSWRDGYLLAVLPVLQGSDWIDEIWLRHVVQTKLIAALRSIALLHSVGGALVAPREGLIPVPCGQLTAEELWDLAVVWKPMCDKLPDKEERTAWSTTLCAWDTYFTGTVDPFPERLTLERLCKSVQEAGSLIRIQTNLGVGTDAKTWMKQLLQAVFKAGKGTLLDEISLLLDQAGGLQRRKVAKVDSGIDPDLKSIADSIGLGLRSTLLDKSMEFPELLNLLTQRTTDDVVKDVVQYLHTGRSKLAASENLRSGSFAFLAWLVRNRQIGLLEGYPVITRATGDHADYVQALSAKAATNQNRLLAPASLWPVPARGAIELFPQNVVLADEYLHSLQAEDWAEIAKSGYIQLHPLHQTTQHIEDFLPDQPLPNADGKSNHRSTKPVNVSAIAYLEGRGGVLERVRSSPARAALLIRFLLDYVLPNDSEAFKSHDTICQCANRHKYYGAGWLEPIWRLQWIKLGEGKTSRINAEALASVVKNDAKLLAAIQSAPAKAMLNALHVSVADLLIRAVSESEEKQIELIGSVALMSEAMGKDSGKLRLVAEEFAASPKFFQEIEQRREHRLRTARNQQIGAAVEEALKVALAAHGLRVTPTGVGSDCEVECDYVVNGQEVQLDLQRDNQSCLVEIKSTSSNIVKMTPKQAETAATHGSRFTLCVVPNGP